MSARAPLISPHQIVDRARQWLGTPYVHQASCRGAGADCLGLVLGIWQELGGTLPQIPAYTRDWSEPSGEERLWQSATQLMHPKPVSQMTAGDLILFRMRDDAVAKHLGILSHAAAETTPARFIHAMSGHGVVECALTRPWARRVVACFAFPGFEKEK